MVLVVLQSILEYFRVDGGTGVTEFSRGLRMADSQYLLIGTGSDLLLYHSGTNSFIQNGNGDLYIKQTANDKDIIFQSDDGSGGLATYFQLDGSRASASVLFTVWPDNSYIALGNAVDLKLHHNGTNSTIENEVGDLNIINDANDKDIAFYCDDGSGGVTAYLTLDGSVVNTYAYKDIRFVDNVLAIFGTGGDSYIKHDGSNMTILNNTGHMTFYQATDDADMVFYCDDGSGGLAEYLRLDGGLGHTTVSKRIRFNDSVDSTFGAGNDLRLQHDGSHSYITNYTGNLYIDQATDDGDLILQCDNGSGGLTPYITLDGSQTTINLQKTVLIGTTTNTGAYKIDVAGKQRVQDILELDDVLMLNAISTPSDPAAGKSVIYMDSADGGIKCKINVGGTVVTRTLASFE
jgi:hypothetical protein